MDRSDDFGWSCAACRTVGFGPFANHKCGGDVPPRGRGPKAGNARQQQGSPLQPDHDSILSNVPHRGLFPDPAARGAGQSMTLEAFFRKDIGDGKGIAEPEADGSKKTDVLVSSFGLYDPFSNLRDPSNPLVELAEAGVRVTVVNHWCAEKSEAEAAGYAAGLGVSPAVVTRIGAHAVRRNLVLVHPPYQQHSRSAASPGQWEVRQNVFGAERKALAGGKAPKLPHPAVLPPGKRTYGVVHSKVFITRWDDGSLRVCVTSGNFGEGEWASMAEVGHAQTFYPLETGGRSLREGGGGSGGAGGSEPPQPPRRVSSAPTVELFLTPATGVYSRALRYMLLNMCVPPETVDALLAGVDFSVAATELICAQPGFNFRDWAQKRDAAGGAATVAAAVTAGSKRPAAAVRGRDDVDEDDDDDDGPGGGAGTKAVRIEPDASRASVAGRGVPQSAQGAAQAPVPPPTLHRTRDALLARLDSEHLHPLKVSRMGHLALRAVQRYARYSVSALLSALEPFRTPAAAAATGGAAKPAPPSTSARWADQQLRNLFPIDGLLVQGSSMGSLQPLTCLNWLASANGVEVGALPAALAKAIKDDFKFEDAERPAAAPQTPFTVVWPEERAALRSVVVEALGNLCWNVGGRNESRVKMPRLYHYEGERGRGGLMPHAKMWLPYSLGAGSSSGGGAAAAARDDSQCLLALHRSLAIATSANASAAAWGRGGDLASQSCMISNWEAGVILMACFRLVLPTALGERVLWAADRLRAGVEPGGLSAEERQLADVLCCFRVSASAPPQHVSPIRLPPRPYGPGEKPWRGVEAAGPAFHAALQRSRQAMAMLGIGGGDDDMGRGGGAGGFGAEEDSDEDAGLRRAMEESSVAAGAASASAVVAPAAGEGRRLGGGQGGRGRGVAANAGAAAVAARAARGLAVGAGAATAISLVDDDDDGAGGCEEEEEEDGGELQRAVELSLAGGGGGRGGRGSGPVDLTLDDDEG